MTIDKQKILEEAQRTVARGDGLLMTVRAMDVLELMAENDALKAAGMGFLNSLEDSHAENEALKSPETGYAGAFYDFCRLVGVVNASPESPAAVFKGQVVPAVEALRKDAERYRWLRSVEKGLVQVGDPTVEYCIELDRKIDEAIAAERAEEAE